MKKIFYIISGVVAAIIIGGLVFFSQRKFGNDTDLKIHFFDAGKADAILISRNSEEGNYNVLIDTGEEELGETILEYFKKKGIEKLDYLIITHFDKDHVGSAAEVIRNIQIGKVLQTNTTKESRYYEEYLKAVNEVGLVPVTVADEENSYEFSLGSMSFIVQGPEGVYEKKESNNSSLITALKFNETKYLFMGDAEDERLEDFFETELAMETYDVLKVPYHGHYQENLEALIRTLNPKYAVITSSFEEMEDSETRALLEEAEAKTFLTRQGAVDITSDGTMIEIRQ